MPSMVPNGGGSEGIIGEGRNELTAQQLSEKLEKSEAGRKKLRQAIALLKEKLDATSQALEVNEALRQEVERERQNVDTERKRADSEKALREKLEKENLSIKEQFVGVLQRLDSLESSVKADRNEFSRIRSEVKEGIGAALQAVEATQGLYQSLERSLHAKINGAVQSSSKALSLAQSGQAATSRAQAAATTAQSLVKAVQKEVQVVSSQVVTLQKQASNLSALEQEPQLKGPCTPLNSPDAGESNVSLAVPKEKVSIDAAGAVLSKTQKAKDDRHVLVASTDKSRSNPMCAVSNGLPPRGGMFLSRSQIPDGGLKSKTTIPPVRPVAISPRKDEAAPRKGPVAIITGVDSILSPAVKVPAKTTPSLYITSPSVRPAALPTQCEVQAQNLGDPPKTIKRPAVKRGRGDPNVAQGGNNKQIIVPPARDVACNTVEDDDTVPSTPYPASTTKLLKSIMKMFEKEGRNRKSMEDKLMQLQGALESHGEVASVGTKRKREKRKDKGDGTSEGKGKKRQKKAEIVSLDVVAEDKHLVPEIEAALNDTQALEDGDLASGDRLSEMISSLQEVCRGEGIFETTVDNCQVNRDVPGAEECKDASSDVDICNDDVSKDETGTNTDLESTDDDLGEDWWAKKVLLSPISSNDLTS